MAGVPHRSIRVFGELCGDKFLTNVVILTTMWDKVRSMEEGGKREATIKMKYWNAMLHHGATVNRFYKDDPKSAWTIVDNLIQERQLGQALLLQEEMVDLGKPLNETTAGKALRRDLWDVLR